MGKVIVLNVFRGSSLGNSGYGGSKIPSYRYTLVTALLRNGSAKSFQLRSFGFSIIDAVGGGGGGGGGVVGLRVG